MRRALAGAAVIGALVSACGGSSPTPTGTTGPSKPSATAGVGRPSATAVAARLQCGGYKPVKGGPELFAATQGNCRIGTKRISLLTFASSDAESNWSKAAKQATGGDGTIVLASGYAIEAQDADQADRLAAQVHGSVQ